MAPVLVRADARCGTRGAAGVKWRAGLTLLILLRVVTHSERIASEADVSWGQRREPSFRWRRLYGRAVATLYTRRRLDDVSFAPPPSRQQPSTNLLHTAVHHLYVVRVHLTSLCLGDVTHSATRRAPSRSSQPAPKVHLASRVMIGKTTTTTRFHPHQQLRHSQCMRPTSETIPCNKRGSFSARTHPRRREPAAWSQRRGPGNSSVPIFERWRSLIRRVRASGCWGRTQGSRRRASRARRGLAALVSSVRLEYVSRNIPRRRNSLARSGISVRRAPKDVSWDQAVVSRMSAIRVPRVTGVVVFAWLAVGQSCRLRKGRGAGHYPVQVRVPSISFVLTPLDLQRLAVCRTLLADSVYGRQILYEVIKRRTAREGS